MYADPIHPPASPLESFHSIPASVGAIALGIALLLAGRRIFWLFVAAVGFVVAFELVSPWVGDDRPGIALILSGVAGLAGAVLAIFVQKVAVALVGAVAGAYYLHRLLEAASMHDPRYGWVSAAIGAVVGSLLLVFVFKWALVFFSSVVGAHLILKQAVEVWHIRLDLAGALFVALVIAGLLVQTRHLRGHPNEDEA